MARPKKEFADYFSHDRDMRNDPKIKAVRRKFGIEGYAVWNMVLETLTGASLLEYEYTDLNINLMAGDFEMDDKRLKDMLDYFVCIGLLKQNEEHKIFSTSHHKRLEFVFKKRGKSKDSYEMFLSQKSTEKIKTESEVIHKLSTEHPHSIPLDNQTSSLDLEFLSQKSTDDDRRFINKTKQNEIKLNNKEQQQEHVSSSFLKMDVSKKPEPSDAEFLLRQYTETMRPKNFQGYFGSLISNYKKGNLDLESIQNHVDTFNSKIIAKRVSDENQKERENILQKQYDLEEQKSQIARGKWDCLSDEQKERVKKRTEENLNMKGWNISQGNKFRAIILENESIKWHGENPTWVYNQLQEDVVYA